MNINSIRCEKGLYGNMDIFFTTVNSKSPQYFPSIKKFQRSCKYCENETKASSLRNQFITVRTVMTQLNVY